MDISQIDDIDKLKSLAYDATKRRDEHQKLVDIESRNIATVETRLQQLQAEEIKKAEQDKKSRGK